ncbi:MULTISPECIES: phage scaffolding protein [Eisenbergiella]|uniref:phage scaffolding protein n=1 Tax=Eisenbergiella TaxID=1432051 RepID=UPI0023F2469E|nr:MULTISPECIES: phage scaffolding protein [Eisenbergiella]MCI6710160.1 phage scaffolding protein [Eisenbergiella massiliensis]MDY5529334.1 phage scaffolding protein [Eisenbergiella porci]
MKNIFELMKEFGFEVPEDKKKDFEKAVLENYKTVKDYDAQREKLEVAEQKASASETTINGLKEDLKKFEGVDVTGLQQRITDLETELKTKETEVQQKLADRDFDALLTESIHGAKGRNAKAIRALLDVDKLKESKNQKDDVAAAIKALTEAEDSKMLFGENDEPASTGSVIGTVKPNSGGTEDAALRAAMGLPPVKAE